MSTTPQPTGQCNIYLNLEQEPEVTEEVCRLTIYTPLSLTGSPQTGSEHRYVPSAGMCRCWLILHCAALGYLYSSVTVRAINPQNARAVLAAGCLLGGMDELCNYAYELCRQSITVENISTWLQFVDAVPAPSDGTSTPVEQQPIPSSRTAIFGPFAHRLREDVWEFLVATLPQSLNVGGLSTPISPHPDGQPSDAGRDTLLQVFALVPFDMFKAAVESPAFHIGARMSAS